MQDSSLSCCWHALLVSSAALRSWYDMMHPPNRIFCQQLPCAGPVERLVQYSLHPEEAPAEVPPGPPPGWPSQGAISARHLEVSYRPDLPPVLHGISFDVAGQQKVGICGRTGGKQ
jgi:ABC-type multidrug transport system fused ATPase/permease subunit